MWRPAHSFTLLDDHLVTAESIGAFQLSDPDDIVWQIEVFTRVQGRAGSGRQSSRTGRARSPLRGALSWRCAVA